MPNSAVMDKAAGTLTVPNATERDQGTYKCTAMNRVGMKECLLELNLPRPPSVAKIAGAAVGGLVAVVLTASISCLTARRIWRRLRHPESETSNEILEDARPPTCRKTCRTLDSLGQS